MTDFPDDPQAAELLDGYLSRLQAGARPDRGAVLGARPDLASALDCLDALEGIAPDEAAVEATGALSSGTAPPPSGLDALPAEFGQRQCGHFAVGAQVEFIGLAAAHQQHALGAAAGQVVQHQALVGGAVEVVCFQQLAEAAVSGFIHGFGGVAQAVFSVNAQDQTSGTDGGGIAGLGFEFHGFS